MEATQDNRFFCESRQQRIHSGHRAVCKLLHGFVACGCTCVSVFELHVHCLVLHPSTASGSVVLGAAPPDSYSQLTNQVQWQLKKLCTIAGEKKTKHVSVGIGASQENPNLRRQTKNWTSDHKSLFIFCFWEQCVNTIGNCSLSRCCTCAAHVQYECHFECYCVRVNCLPIQSNLYSL